MEESASQVTPETRATDEPAADAPEEEQASYVKLAMRNMVRKKGTSLTHFFLSATGLLGLLIGLAYLTR
ncbi:DUF3285 domain-containing protein [Spirulina major CS-329]|jgi:hypothetical protein|uniref:DUF3285 domain-containing protein n=1 Tax=Spirulina TaxID=1154 RepID=UPI00232F8FFA|nr:MULTISPECIES: DUF3285 domain-containing protein [Spirulina]MDB9493366.1 DUF3285 domain-containing protein [Spirulina subsalsa CS-330]MDB9502818.1 DUF3285 domain-containing protein [Spirulina major CS-329]